MRGSPWGTKSVLGGPNLDQVEGEGWCRVEEEVVVEVSGLTGEHRVRLVDILHDVGNSLVPTIGTGQVEGGFVQGG